MVALDIVRASNASLVKAQPLVAVFVGGTAGIGEYSVRALAATHGKEGKGLRLYIVGRNAIAAEKIITDCTQVCPSGHFRFIKASNLSLLTDVDRCCDEITCAERDAIPDGDGGLPRVDLLVLSQGVISFAPRKDTNEGLDAVMSLMYYSRVRFVNQLLPLLIASPLAGRVVSVLNPKLEGMIFFPDDLSLRDPQHFKFSSASHTIYLKTFFFEGLAKRYPGKVSLSHYYPGFVVTDLVSHSPLPRWAKVLALLATPLTKLKAVPSEECGQRVMFLTSKRFRPLGEVREEAKSDNSVERAMSSDGMMGGGAYRVDWNGEIIPNKAEQKQLRDQGMVDKVWDHTMAAFDSIAVGRRFED